MSFMQEIKKGNVKYILIGLLGLISCKPSNPSSAKNPLIGKWVLQSFNGSSFEEMNDFYIVFYEDHKVLENTINGERYRTWKLDENELCVSSSLFTICEKYEIKGDSLIFGNITYRRE
jgi:hypothetical protein